MIPRPHSCSRRIALSRLAMASLAAIGARPAFAVEPTPLNPLTFFVLSDPQIHLDKWGTAGTEMTIKTLNELPGKPFPLGGTVAEPRAVIITGDMVDTVADPRHWECYKRFFDPNGGALLRYRTFELIGNHDLSSAVPAGEFSAVQREFIERNRRRRGDVFHFDAANYHYSWNWGPLHLVNLNLFPGNRHRPVYDREAPWNDPRHSLDFLRDDLKSQVGDSGRPVVLCWHYGLRGWGLEKWWTPEDLANLKEAIEPYNIVLILHGHEHAFASYEWEGYPVFMCPSPQIDRDPNTPDVASTPKGFLVVRLIDRELQVAHHSATGWRETWSKKITLGNSR
jgi:cytolysin (calcineurin-like family phosphatase)